MLPAMAVRAKSQGFPWWETNRSSNRSVLPGMGMGTMDESTTATKNSPTGPSFMSHCGTSE
jgi:hypothetical protein